MLKYKFDPCSVYEHGTVWLVLHKNKVEAGVYKHDRVDGAAGAPTIRGNRDTA